MLLEYLKDTTGLNADSVSSCVATLTDVSHFHEHQYALVLDVNVCDKYITLVTDGLVWFILLVVTDALIRTGVNITDYTASFYNFH